MICLSLESDTTRHRKQKILSLGRVEIPHAAQASQLHQKGKLRAQWAENLITPRREDETLRTKGSKLIQPRAQAC